MEDTEPTAGQNTRGKDGNQEVDRSLVLMGTKPLHRFIRGEPRCLGIIILFFGVAELLMGFQLSKDRIESSTIIYIPFWQGALFLIAGNLSLYTGVHPSKRMVTVCLAMYVVCLLGIPVSVGYRIFFFTENHDRNDEHHYHYDEDHRVSYDREWLNRIQQLISVEAILFVSSLFVSTLLIFLTVMARLALKSTNTQVILHHTLPVQRNATAS